MEVYEVEKEKEVKRLVDYINKCIAAGESPILTNREVKLLQANKDLIPTTQGTHFII